MTQRSPIQRAGVFISYALADAKPFADALRQILEDQRLTVWQDVVSLRGGEDWWDQITDALDHVEFMVMILTPKSLERPTVQREWRYARQHGVCVLPILASPDLIFEELPKWLSRIQIYRLGFDPDRIAQSESWTRFFNDLQTTCTTTREPFMAEEMPLDYVPRPALSDKLINLLLDENRQKPVAAFKGAGGYGKTSLARALCHDDRIRETFYHGILWVTLGENATRDTIFERVESLIYALSGEKSGAPTLESAVKRLAELWQDRELLLVIDDVWRADHLNYFMDGGARVARLITTRINDTLPTDTRADRTVSVSEMEATEAAQMLSHGLDPDQSVKTHIDTLAERLGEYPLLLKLANGMLRDRVRLGNDITAALEYVNKALTRRGLGILRKDNTDDRNRAVDVTLSLSIDLLKAEEKSRFMQLAIFRDDLDIPLAALEKLWSYDDFDTEELCIRLDDLSLLLKFDLPAQTIRLHDVVRQYLREIKAADLATINTAFLDAYEVSNWADLPDDEPYLWDELFYHLAEADRTDQLTATALDLWYVARKTALKGTAKTEADLSKSGDATVALLQRQYTNMAHILPRCANIFEIASTLHARLSHLDTLQPSCAALAHKFEGQPHITAWKRLPDLPHLALIRTFTGHTNGVSACAFSPSRAHILSASGDGTLKLWDAASGAEIRTFVGHTSSVTACAFSRSGTHILSASWDETLKLWDAATGAEIHTFMGHTEPVTACAFSPDGKYILSASADNTLKLWDAATGVEIHTFTGHKRDVTACAFSPNGAHVLSASDDTTLKLWDVATGAEIRTFTGHKRDVTACAFSPNGTHILSALLDNTLKLWDVATGAEIHTFTGHTAHVTACAFSPTGTHILSASHDGTLKLWDAASGAEIHTFTGHTEPVTACAFSPTGTHILSASYDRTLKLWDVAFGAEIHAFMGHTEDVTACAFSPTGTHILSASYDFTLKLWDAAFGAEIHTFTVHNGDVNACTFSPTESHILSASADRTLRLWDAASGQAVRTFTGHTGSVNACAFSPTGTHILSASYDRTLRLWDAASGAEIRTFTGHTGSVNTCAFSPTGTHILSASSDRTLKLWDAASGVETHTFTGHTWSVTACAFSPTGTHILSASYDRTLKLWDTATGAEIRTFTGHTDWVNACAFSPDGSYILSASRDSNLKLWDTETGVCLATFYAEAPLISCAIHPDGQHIIAGGRGGYLYWLKIEGLIELNQ